MLNTPDLRRLEPLFLRSFPKVCGLLFMELLEMHLVRLGVNQAKQVLLLADGAEWIWLRIPTLLRRLGCPPLTFPVKSL